ncbi:Hemimethylated DNA-binding protein YccV like-domain-containing protein [Truncatella angustata]|uniref:Hemimethylated DNA-binding protein YccV like-domain-containing protein n=1 Tax=Truncatella angustata TaxID=152316 RepID=A0A9P8RLP1_9PEZI|nr:Hemimethylated DNA-binding protein YccV like-domain-containing protein [Truncatella angustata]KAH6645520.1 Hemimethylated DNA-binding protein YccV like-domain-containing protein [Truncatella angustata]
MQGTPGLLRLPEELLDAIVQYLNPSETIALGRSCKQADKAINSPLVWRRHCVETWKGWHRKHELAQKLVLPPTQTEWRDLFNGRRKNDRALLDVFDEMLLTQRYRYQRMELIASHGPDAVDMLARMRTATPDSDDYVLARRYYAGAILGQIRRAKALDIWTRLGRGDSMRIDEALGAYDLFVYSEYNLGVDDLSGQLDSLAHKIQAFRQDFNTLSIRERAILIADIMRAQDLLGLSEDQEYHALQNNFLSTAFRAHSSLPLQSVALYCAIAQRLGINASPSNYPQHVHTVIQAPTDRTLDGDARDPEVQVNAQQGYMYMDPWRSSEEVAGDQLQLRLTQMGIPASEHVSYLGPASILEMTLRTGRNIMVSVEEARHRPTNGSTYPDVETAWYAMLWVMVILGDSDDRAAFTRRRQFIPYLVQHFQSHYPEDIHLMELVPTLFEQQRERQVLIDMLAASRDEDCSERIAKLRDTSNAGVQFSIGHYFRHKQYKYRGFVIGWDAQCMQPAHWISQMRVDDLPRGRSQPFYNVVAEDKSTRYVAEENIEILDARPSDILMEIAGRYFKRWSDNEHKFESNMLDDYPNN